MNNRAGLLVKYGISQAMIDAGSEAIADCESIAYGRQSMEIDDPDECAVRVYIAMHRVRLGEVAAAFGESDNHNEGPT